MARILGIFSVPLPASISQVEMRGALVRWLPEDLPERDKLLAACGHTGIESRAALAPLAEVLEGSSFTERNRRYGAAMVEFGTAAVARALEVGGWAPERFHSFIKVSCTGVTIPPADVRIMAALAFPPSLRRLPVTEMGCVGGAFALSRGAEVVEAHPALGTVCGQLAKADLALILSAEFPSLNFQLEDLTPANAVASLIFGDAVVAVVLGPDGVSAAARARDEPSVGTWRSPRVVASRSHVVPETADVLGFDLRSSGFHIVLGREVPFLIRDLLRGLVSDFLRDLGWALQEVEHWAIHPGGQKVVRVLLEALGLPESKGAASLEILRKRGNASSAAVLLVLERLGREAGAGERGLVVAFGPGFSVELVAVQW
jgi:alkylresorcinol/alkylpyrone synthase